MNAEPTTARGTTAPTGPDHRWADDGGVLTEERYQDPDSMDPGAPIDAVGPGAPGTAEEVESPEGAGAVSPTMTEATSNPVLRTPLLLDEAQQEFLSHWAEIQVGFVEDPAGAVRDAEGLIDEIAAAWQAAFRARRNDLAADWRDGSPGTEELRLALRRYREFIGVILPK